MPALPGGDGEHTVSYTTEWDAIRSRLAACLIFGISLSADFAASEACRPQPAYIANILAEAEEHRGWVEFWIDLDPREASAELGYFAYDLRRAGEALSGAPCMGGFEDPVLTARISHEWRWHARMLRLLSKSPVSTPQAVANAER